jgi:hypothetical protein
MLSCFKNKSVFNRSSLFCGSLKHLLICIITRHCLSRLSFFHEFKCSHLVFEFHTLHNWLKIWKIAVRCCLFKCIWSWAYFSFWLLFCRWWTGSGIVSSSQHHILLFILRFRLFTSMNCSRLKFDRSRK